MSNNEQPDDFTSAGLNVYDTPLQEEASRSFLEYSYSVITSRALPDARDGLKPVHRRILYSMSESGLRPDHSFVKSARVVGDCMGRYHPHGDSAIYEALVRLTQDFALNSPLISGHGNFGSPNDGPAASRYTECRLSPAAMLLVDELDENTVDFAPNYDGSIQEPTVLPAAYPNLLVNGASGIAVGMATNMIPHNLGEAVAAARLLIKKPQASLDEVMEIMPGPDLPTGGQILGLDEVRRAYEEGRGSIRIRGKAEILPLEGSRGRSMIVVTELPYSVGTEKVIEKIKDELGKKRLQGISDVKDLSDRRNGLRLVIETKTGVNPSALLTDLYRYTPMETSFGIANLTLVKGEPRTLSLLEMLHVFLDHRYEVVRRRTQYRLDKAEARKHIVEGLLIALDAIDEVVKIIKASKDTAEARTNLCDRFDLSDIQAGHILDMPLRRLVNLEIEALRDEKKTLEEIIAGYQKILNSDKVLRAVVDDELSAVAAKFAAPRKTELVSGDLEEILAASKEAAAPLSIENEPVEIYLSSTGLLMRTPASSEEIEEKKPSNKRTRHDTVISSLVVNTHDSALAITNQGNAYKFMPLDIPALASRSGRVSIRGGVPMKELVPLEKGESVVGLAPVKHETALGIALATKSGIIKINNFDIPQRSSSFSIISLKPEDSVISAGLINADDLLVFVSSDASLLTFKASLVRPQGRTGGGVQGIKLAEDASLIGFSLVDASLMDTALVVTSTGETVKVSMLADFPSKGRATGGVRSHKFLKNETQLVAAVATVDPGASGPKGEPSTLPTAIAKRDASGQAAEPFTTLGRLIFN